VCKARDTRLDGDVALKVSKAEFTERFGREARAFAMRADLERVSASALCVRLSHKL
jgi:hypothetical protein